jgi:flagellar basal body rod protein FlgG
MTHGVYSAGAAMARLELFQEVTANNLANAGTTGFRRDLLAAREAAPGDKGIVRGPLALGRIETTVHLDSGPVEPTGATTDLAIMGSGFFVVQAQDGRSYLTRAGAFALNENGELVNPAGDRLMGEGGPIALESPAFAVSADGEVSAGGAVVDRIRLAGVAPGTALRKAGSGRIEMPSGGAVAQPEGSILQGHLEGSNVNAIREMVSLVEAFRVYQANSKTITTADDTLGKAVNEVGRVA